MCFWFGWLVSWIISANGWLFIRDAKEEKKILFRLAIVQANDNHHHFYHSVCQTCVCVLTKNSMVPETSKKNNFFSLDAAAALFFL